MNQELIPNSVNLFLRPYFYVKKVQDRQNDNTIPYVRLNKTLNFNSNNLKNAQFYIDSTKAKITEKIFSSIINSELKDHIIEESDIQKFIQSCKQISPIPYDKYNFQETMKLDLEVYQMCLQKIDQTGLSSENKSKIHYLLDSLNDYTSNIMRISQREKELENICEQLDCDDLKRSLYGTILSFVCVMIGILETPIIKIDTNVLTLLINEGFKFASELDAYTDTLDILTNPNELHLLEKSESYIAK